VTARDGLPARLSGDWYRKIHERVEAFDRENGTYDVGIGFYREAALPDTPRELAGEATWCILGSGITHVAARKINSYVQPHMDFGGDAREVVKNRNKAAGINMVWRDRDRLFRAIMDEAGKPDGDPLSVIADVPVLRGPAIRYHFGKNIGLQVAKPDLHLTRLAKHSGETVQGLCQRLSRETGELVPVIDYVLFRACEQGWIESRNLEPTP
jgi:hypothetical protein